MGKNLETGQVEGKVIFVNMDKKYSVVEMGGKIKIVENEIISDETFEIIEHKVEVILCRLCKRVFGTVVNAAVVIIVCGFAFNALHGARPSLLRVYAGDDLHFHALLQGIDIQLRCRAFYTVRTAHDGVDHTHTYLVYRTFYHLNIQEPFLEDTKRKILYQPKGFLQ